MQISRRAFRTTTPRGTALRWALSCAILFAALASSDAAAQTDRSIFSVLDTGGRNLTLAMSADGMLSADDVLSAGGRRVQVWSLSVQPGDGLQVDLRSADFDAFLYLVGPGLGEGLRDDDGGEGLNSRLCVSVDQAGDYRIVASSLGGDTGAFTLDVTEVAVAVSGTCQTAPEPEAVEDLADLDTADRILSIGDDVSGRLGAGDALVFESPAQAWAVEGEAGAPFSVDLVSEEFDAYLMVEGPGLDSWLQDDDGAGLCNSRLTFTFPQTGTYRVVASTLGDSGGGFRLIATETPRAVNPGLCEASFGEEEGLASGSPQNILDVGTLPMDGEVAGTMVGDEAQYEGRSLQGWALEGTAGDRLAIELRSADFDSYLFFLGPGFEDPLWDDDGAGSLNSLICVELSESGTYRVLAGPLSEGGAGSRYTLRATRVDQGVETLCETFVVSPEVLAARLANLPTEGRSVGLETEVTGALTLQETRHPDSDRLIQAWNFDAPGERVFIDVVSEDFDPVLYAVGGSIVGELYNDDFSGAEGCNTRLEIGPDVSGSVTLLVGSFYNQASGEFLIRTSTNPGPLEAGGCVGGDAGSTGGTETSSSVTASLSSGEGRPIEIGTEVFGQLGPFEEALPGGQPAQTWSVEVNAGDALVIELISEDFDPVLYLDGPGLFTPLTDDDGMGLPNSRIEYTASESGRLRIVVSVFAAEEGTGRFRLRVIRGAR